MEFPNVVGGYIFDFTTEVGFSVVTRRGKREGTCPGSETRIPMGRLKLEEEDRVWVAMETVKRKKDHATVEERPGWNRAAKARKRRVDEMLADDYLIA